MTAEYTDGSISKNSKPYMRHTFNVSVPFAKAEYSHAQFNFLGGRSTC